MADDWADLNFKPDTTDKQLPITKPATNRLVVTDVETAAPLSSVPVFVRSLRIKAERKNAGLVFIGNGSSVDLRNNGFPLDAGEVLPFEVNDLSVVFFQGDTVGDAIRIIYGR